MRAVFDVAKTDNDPAKLNRRIETVARYLNMHVRAGLPADALKATLVLRGAASRDALNHATYRRLHGMDNPNLELLQELQRS